MSLYLNFPAGWWVIIGFIFGLYLLLFFQRRSYLKEREVKSQLIFATVTLVISFTIEVIAVNFKVWTYFPGNWPVILWPTYFGSGLLGYQLVKKIEELS